MHVHAIDLDEVREEDYYLIGIHSTLEDFKLAYHLNNNLNTQFKRAAYNLDFEESEGKASFSVFDYVNEKYDFEWYMIANTFINQNSTNTDLELFASETKSYLIPEKKTVDYFLKIIGEADYDYIKRSIDKLNSISGVITSYMIDPLTLKSKDHLIF